MKSEKKKEKGITLIQAIIIIAVIAVVFIIIKWAYGLSELVEERTKNQQIQLMNATSTHIDIG